MNKEQAKVLLVEDNPSDAELITELLADEERSPFNHLNYEVSWTNRYNRALEFLEENSGIDCVLLDLLLPDSKGIETFLNLQKRIPNTPIVILSGLDYTKFGKMAMENGAADYLDKAVDLEGNLLGHAIQFAIAREQGKNKEKQLKEERRIHETSLKSVIKNNSDPMLILDKDGTIISANMVYLSLLGQSPKKLNGQKFKYSLHPDKTSEIKFKHKNGKNSWLNVHISEILWNNEKAYLAHFFDRRMRHLIQQNG